MELQWWIQKKFRRILSVDADIYVIQECENPDSCSDAAYREFSENSIWTDENKSTGWGIFLKSGIGYTKKSLAGLWIAKFYIHPH